MFQERCNEWKVFSLNTRRREIHVRRWKLDWIRLQLIFSAASQTPHHHQRHQLSNFSGNIMFKAKIWWNFLKVLNVLAFYISPFFANKIWSGRSPGSNQPRCVSISECIAAKISKYSLIDVSQNWAESNSITKCLGIFIGISISNFFPPNAVFEKGEETSEISTDQNLWASTTVLSDKPLHCVDTSFLF